VIYDVRQTTTCAYASPVAHARHVLRLTPVSRDGERVQVASLQIVPEPMHRRDSKDFFGNVLTWIEIAEPHDTLTVKLSARVAVDAPVEPPPLSTPAWETVREEAFATSDIGPTSPAHFLFPSRMVSLDPEIRDYTRESFSPRRPVLDAAIELIHRLKSDIVYAIGAASGCRRPMSAAICAPRRRRTRRGCKAAKPCMPGCCCGAAPTPAGLGSIPPMRFLPPRSTSPWRSAATIPMSRRWMVLFWVQAGSAWACP
jgi:hypothetical protein